jgi:hypothetical protein
MKNSIVGVFITCIYKQCTRSKNAKIEFHVSGMCKKGSAKCIVSEKSSDWHMDCGTLYLIVNEQKTDVTTIQKLLL